MWLLLLLLLLLLLRRALLLLLPFFHRFLCFCSRPFHSPAHRLSFARLSHSFFSSLQSFQFRSREPFRPFFIQFKLPKLDRLFSFVRFVRVVVVVVGVEAHDERVIVVVVGISSSSTSSSSSHGRRPGHERFPSRSFFVCVRVLLVLVARRDAREVEQRQHHAGVQRLVVEQCLADEAADEVVCMPEPDMRMLLIEQLVVVG